MSTSNLVDLAVDFPLDWDNMYAGLRNAEPLPGSELTEVETAPLPQPAPSNHGATEQPPGLDSQQPANLSNSDATQTSYRPTPLPQTASQNPCSRPSSHSSATQPSLSSYSPSSPAPQAPKQNPTSARRHTCTQSSCNKTFSRLSDLKRHTNTIHAKANTFPCPKPTCKHASSAEPFRRKDHLTQHLVRTGHGAADEANSGFNPSSAFEAAIGQEEASESQPRSRPRTKKRRRTSKDRHDNPAALGEGGEGNGGEPAGNDDKIRRLLGMIEGLRSEVEALRGQQTQ